MMRLNYIFGIIVFLFISCKKETKKETVPNETSTMQDIDGNVYKTVKIGDQWWMAENLKVHKYSDGTAINEISISGNDSIWENTQVGSFCSADARFGLLYNWFSVNNSKKIAPQGWHIPSDEEWKTLEKSLGTKQEEADGLAWRGSNTGLMLMKTSIEWVNPIEIYSSTVGFDAIPSGCRVFNGSLNNQTNTAFFWTSTEHNNQAWYRYLDSQQKGVYRQFTYKNYGFSIRCVKD